MYYFALQSNSSLLNLVLLGGHCLILQDPKQDLKIKAALYIRILTFSSSITSVEIKVVSDNSFGSWRKTTSGGN